MKTSTDIAVLINSITYLYNQIRNHPTIQAIIDFEPRFLTTWTVVVLGCILFNTGVYWLVKGVKAEQVERATCCGKVAEASSSGTDAAVSEYPPGMQVDVVLEKWKRVGMDTSMAPPHSNFRLN